MLYVSTHQYPFYPGTGAVDEVGEGAGAGPHAQPAVPGAASATPSIWRAFRDVIVPVARSSRREFVLVSAGFDADRRDPLGGMAVSEQGFAALARTLLGVAEEVAGGRIVAVLEGGYDLSAMHASTAAVLDELRANPRAPLPPPVSTSARPVLDAVRRRHADFWDF